MTRQSHSQLYRSGLLALSPQLSAFISALPASFETGGRVIYTGRNTLKSFRIDGRELIVKRYRRLSFARSLLYLGRTSKARRAYEYAHEYLRRGIRTPEPLAYIDLRRGPLLHDSYFISLPLYAPDLTTLRRPDYDSHEVALLSRFVYELQQRGLLHGDLNLTNILLADATACDPLRRYAVIDLNRSRILPSGKLPTLSQRSTNLMRLTHRRDLLRAILRSFPQLPAHNTRLITQTFRQLFRLEARKRFLHRIFSH